MKYRLNLVYELTPAVSREVTEKIDPTHPSGLAAKVT